MSKVLLHTPEGVRDIYNEECEKKIHLQTQIHKLLKLYGYNDIQTPTFEFFDIFGKDMGSVPSKNMYKFFDREGNTLVLRPDMTPSIARAVSKYFMDEDMPIRFCYMGNSFINNAEHQGKLKEITQIGAELIGDNKSDADVETIALVINALLDCGLKEFQIEVGHTGIFAGIVEEAGFNDEETEELMTLLDNKNFFGVEEMIKNTSLPDNMKSVILKLSQLVGSVDVIKEAKKLISNKKIEKALDRMEKVFEMLTYYDYEKYVSFDLGNVANHQYYTGIIFKGYTYGTGDAIVTGGRYDNLLKLFGKDSPSMGFSLNLDQLLIAMNRQNIQVNMGNDKVLILYEENCKQDAVEECYMFRTQNISATMIRKSSKKTLDDYKEFALKNKMKRIVYFNNNQEKEEVSL